MIVSHALDHNVAPYAAGAGGRPQQLANLAPFGNFGGDRDDCTGRWLDPERVDRRPQCLNERIRRPGRTQVYAAIAQTYASELGKSRGKARLHLFFARWFAV